MLLVRRVACVVADRGRPRNFNFCCTVRYCSTFFGSYISPGLTKKKVKSLLYIVHCVFDTGRTASTCQCTRLVVMTARANVLAGEASHVCAFDVKAAGFGGVAFRVTPAVYVIPGMFL